MYTHIFLYVYLNTYIFLYINDFLDLYIPINIYLYPLYIYLYLFYIYFYLYIPIYLYIPLSFPLRNLINDPTCNEGCYAHAPADTFCLSRVGGCRQDRQPCMQPYPSIFVCASISISLFVSLFPVQRAHFN